MKGKYLGHLLLTLIGTIASISYAQYSNDYGTHLDDELRRYCNRQTAYSTGVSDARKGLARKEDFAQVCRSDREYYNASYNTGYNYGLSNQSGLIVNEPAPYHPEIYQQLPSSYTTPYTRPVQAGTAPGAVTNPNLYRVGPYGTATSYDSKPAQAPIYPGEVYTPTGDFVKPDPVHGLRSHIEVGPSPFPKCIETVNGEACGYNCINSMNNVRCAKSPDQVCRANEKGQIACGYHCIATIKTVRCAMVPTDTCVSDHNGKVFCGINCRITNNAQGYCDIERYAP